MISCTNILTILIVFTSPLFLQAGITNGDYEAAGFSGQLDVVTLDSFDSYKESEGVNPAAVAVPIVIIAVLVTVLAVVLLL